MMIATHNSGTGERSGGWLSYLVAPFSVCQSKTLKEQYNAGARLFDLRVRKVDDRWVFAHGLWTSKDAVSRGLSDLNLAAYEGKKKALLLVTYEGRCEDETEFLREVRTWDCYEWLEVVEVSVKKPKWRMLIIYKHVRFEQCFAVIEGWRRLLPVPWLWSKIKKYKISKKKFNMFDFV